MRIIDLFAGAGGSSEGARQAGAEIVAAVDNWPIALESHRVNHPKALHILANIEELYSFNLPACDVVIGSPPCTEFSQAKGDKADPEAGMVLVNEFLRLVEEIAPRYWVLENVPQLKKYLPRSAAPVQVVLNAASFGVPQTRKRLFAGDFVVPRPTHAGRPTTTLDGRRLERWRGWGEALGLTDADGRMLAAMDFTRGTKEGKHLIDACDPAPTLRANDQAYIVGAERPANTIDHTAVVRSGHREHHESMSQSVVRRLTVAECAILQGFPPGYVFCGGVSAQRRQIGNAVPPPVMRAIIEAIMEADE